MSATTEIEDAPRGGNNPAPRSSQNKAQLLQATMRNVPKLKELNYTQWKNVITNSIKNAKLWGYVDGSIGQPSEDNVNELEVYFDEAGAVRSAILGSLESGAQRYIEEALDPRDAWLTLEKKYLTAEADTDTKLVSIQKQLAALKLDEGGDIVEHIAEFCCLRSQLNGTRFALDDPASVSMLYRSLPPTLRQSAVTSDGTEMKEFSALCARLSYLSQNPVLEASIDNTSTAPIEDYTNWGVPEDVKSFGLTGGKNPLLEERASVTCRDCLLKDHEAGTLECPQYEWRRELWGEDAKQPTGTSKDTDTQELSKSNKRFSYEFSEPVKTILSFQELKLKDHLVQNLSRARLVSPQGIQQCAILPTINGRNVIAQAPPETGKTTAIILSVAQLTDKKTSGVQAIIVSPTEEKSADIQSMTGSLGYQCYRSSSKQSVMDEITALAEGHEFPILVGTPVRVLQLLQRGILRTSEIKLLALDDLDVLVENGINNQLSDFYQHLPRSIQTLITCSAFPAERLQELSPYIHKPLHITIERFNGVFRELTHSYIIVPSNLTKEGTIYRIISGGAPIQTGILCDTLSEVNVVGPHIRQYGYTVHSAHQSMNSEEQQQIINNFRNGHQHSHLITITSVHSNRMLGAWDRENFRIVNYDTPSSPQNYIERINFLGVCRGKNVAITLVNEGADEINMIREIERHFNIQMCATFSSEAINSTPVDENRMDPLMDLEIGSRAWYNEILCIGLGYPSLEDWQLESTIEICNGRDVVCIVATGAGKSALIQGPILAMKAMERSLLGIVVVPTKGLADDQARAAGDKELRALALHQDSVRAAAEENPPRNLFNEIQSAKWDLVFLSPEMLASSRFSQLLSDSTFLKRIGLMGIDECHLVDEWKGFRAPYEYVKRLRNRLPSHVAWVALSATIPRNEFQTIVTEGLGFMPQKFKLIQEPVDRPTIKYIPRIFQQSSSSMLDLATIIPFNMKSIDEVPITIIFVNTITYGRELRLFLTSLLPSNITGRARKYFIRGYHGMSSGPYREASVKALREGTETRIIIGTNTAAFGLDIPEVEQVIIAQHSSTFKTQTQRIGRIRGSGTAIIYYQGWVSKSSGTKEAQRLRGQMEKVMIDFANASQEKCPRQIACEYWGEPFVQPEICCSFHNPGDDDKKYQSELALRVQEAKRHATRNRKAPPGPAVNSRGLRPIDKKLVPMVIHLLREWRIRTWQSVTTRRAHDPPVLLLSDKLLGQLCARIHLCVSMEAFRSILEEWDGLDTWGTKLYEVVKAVLLTTKKITGSQANRPNQGEGAMEVIESEEDANLGSGTSSDSESDKEAENATRNTQDEAHVQTQAGIEINETQDK